MESSTVRGCGQLFSCDYLKDGENVRIARDFFQRLSEEIIRTSMRYYKQLEEHSFSYRERQSASYILPSLYKITDGAILAEQPITRKRGTAIGKDGYGYLDYWAWYRDTAFAIEVKHGFYSVHSGITRKDVKDKWESACDQLAKVKREDITDKGNAFVKIALLVVPFFKSTMNGELDVEAWDDVDAFSDMTEMFREDLVKNTPNIFSYWALKKEVQKFCYLDDKGNDRKEIYPVLALIGWIEST